ncbi:MAG: hypothetical protein QXP36_07575 [Conexivisphaerales archaeon]
MKKEINEIRNMKKSFLVMEYSINDITFGFIGIGYTNSKYDIPEIKNFKEFIKLLESMYSKEQVELFEKMLKNSVIKIRKFEAIPVEDVKGK